MLIEVQPGHCDPHPLLEPGPAHVSVRGRVSRVFVLADPDLCLVADDPRELQDAIRERGRTLRPNLEGISNFLHHGFVDAPHTVHANLYRLSEGDTLEVRPGLSYQASYTCSWRNSRSREDSVPSSDRLLELLASAVHKSIGSAPATLMLSSGKDSVALALACQQAGRTDVRTLTFTSGSAGEARDAEQFARRLGLEHLTVELPDDPQRIEAVLARYFTHATEPCGDPTLIPYLLAVAGAAVQPGEFLIDGLNNDSWVGYAPSAAELRGARISDRWLAWLRPLRGHFPVESRVSAALKTRAEWHFFGGRWLRHAETRRFFEGSVDTHQRWQRRSAALRDRDDFDFRAEVRGRHADQNAMIVKAFVTAESQGLRAAFPYTDTDLSSWYFNLPEADRFDRAALMNKVSLRRLLRERLDYDDARLGKRVFEFDGPAFLRAHRSWVVAEIAGCPWWRGSVRPLVCDLIDRPAALDKTWPSILALFQISGWLTRNLPPEETA